MCDILRRWNADHYRARFQSVGMAQRFMFNIVEGWMLEMDMQTCKSSELTIDKMNHVSNAYLKLNIANCCIAKSNLYHSLDEERECSWLLMYPLINSFSNT